MGWNGSNRASSYTHCESVNDSSNKHKSPIAKHGLLAGLIVVMLGCAVVLWFVNADEKQVRQDCRDKKSSSEIPEAASATITNKATTKAEDNDCPTIKTYRDEKGILRYEGGARVPRPEDFVNPTRIISKSIMPVFRHPVESEIAALLTCRPGAVVAGVVRYDTFKQDFANAIVDKIEIAEDDSPRQKEIKQAVIEAKKELAERIKAGEDIVQILKDTRNELRRMSEYKHDIEKMVREQLTNPELSDDDVKLAYAAANKMLEEKGIAPIRMNNLLLQRERLQAKSQLNQLKTKNQ